MDYQFDIGPRPLFLFGVKDNDKARLATISCLEFQRRRIPFKGVMVHQDFESGITKKDRTRITSASDKQFPSLDDFRRERPAVLRTRARGVNPGIHLLRILDAGEHRPCIILPAYRIGSVPSFRIAR